MRFVIWCLVLAGCVSETPRAELVQLGPRPAPPWAAVREALVECTQLQGVSGDVLVRIEIDDDGGAGDVSANRGGGALAQCVGQALVAVRFPADHRGRAIEVPFVAHG